jgi:predicted nucleotidyltransferase
VFLLPSPSQPVSVTLTIRNRCDDARIEACFKPLIDDALATYVGVLGDRIVDIRLQGSVARGDAVVGRSDIDFMALLAEGPSAEEMRLLEARAEELSRHYPVASRVELDAASVDSLIAFQRFVLSSDSLSVYGTDRLTRRSQRINRLALARLVTPDAGALIENYRALMQEIGADEQAVRFYGRIVAKDLLKCVRGVVLVRGGSYQVSVECMHRQVAK